MFFETYSTAHYIQIVIVCLLLLAVIGCIVGQCIQTVRLIRSEDTAEEVENENVNLYI